MKDCLKSRKYFYSVTRDFWKKGFNAAYTHNPDLGINVSARLHQKTKVTTTTEPLMYGGYYGYRRGFYDPWMSYGYGTSTHVSQYTEGTVNIDIVDMAQKRMVWEGVAIGRLKEGRSNAEVREAIDSGVAKMFDGYQVQVRR